MNNNFLTLQTILLITILSGTVTVPGIAPIWNFFVYISSEKKGNEKFKHNIISGNILVDE